MYFNLIDSDMITRRAPKLYVPGDEGVFTNIPRDRYLGACSFVTSRHSGCGDGQDKGDRETSHGEANTTAGTKGAHGLSGTQKGAEGDMYPKLRVSQWSTCIQMRESRLIIVKSSSRASSEEVSTGPDIRARYHSSIQATQARSGWHQSYCAVVGP